MDSHAREKPFALLITGLFFAAVAIGIWHHSMWRDELQAWMIARDSHSLISFYRNTRYDGHPPLWHFSLMLLSSATRSPWIMQVFECVIATGTVFVFAQYAPFPRLARALFALGYYPLFDYGIIARGYPLGALLLLIFCAWVTRRPYSLVGAAVWLVLLANSSGYGFILALSCAAYMLVALTDAKGAVEDAPPAKAKGFGVASLIVAVGFLLAVLWALPPNDRGYGNIDPLDARTLLDGARHLSEAEVNTFVPLGPGTRGYWNTAWLLNHTDQAHLTPLLFLAASALAVLFLIVVARDRPAVALYIVGTPCFLVLMHISYPFLRHEGNVYLMRLAALWLSVSTYSTLPPGPADGGGLRRVKRWLFSASARSALLLLMLSFHAAMGVVAFADAFRRPFSTARDTAAFISHGPYADLPLVAYRPDFLSSGVGGYIDRPMFFIEGNREGTFIVWDRKRNQQPPKDDEPIAREFLRTHGNRALFVGPKNTYPPFTPRDPVTVTPLVSFDRDSISGEDIALYLVTLHPPGE